MDKLHLKTLVVNADTIAAARLKGDDLWEQTNNEPHMIFMAPEQLISKEFSDLVKDDGMLMLRTCILAIDEVHLLNTWGKGFRKAYQQIGWVRSRLRNVVLLALTATMRGGAHIQSVCHFLGLHQGRFHLIRQSNARPEVQMLIRVVKFGFGGRSFPYLDWILREKRKTIIFCRTINLGFRVFSYLYYLALETEPDADLNKRIRLYNALNWPSYNEETRALMENNPDCQIAIGTDSLSVGVDISNIQDVIVLDEPEDIDDLVQKFGRPGRDLELAKDPRGILYVTERTIETARTVVESGQATGGRPKKAQSQSKVEEVMDPSMAEMYLAACKPDEQDRQYENMADSDRPLCKCQGCELSPAPRRTYPCQCSGCTPEELPTLPLNTRRQKSRTEELEVPKSKRLTKAM